ncbi:DUF2142 domain-containing protein [Desulfamplus magnetovallimortis]|nr:DUF2142 domain-containing protein [Desulfamplus magnetovallimortis]
MFPIKCRVSFLFAVMLILMAFIYAVVIPPFEAPDEPFHFLRAFGITEGEWILESHQKKVVVFVHERMFRHPEFAEFVGDSLLKDVEKVPNIALNTALYSPVPYFFHAVALKCGAIILSFLSFFSPALKNALFGGDGNTFLYYYILFYLSRLTSIGLYAAIVLWIAGSSSSLKWPFLWLLATPMVIAQSASINIDVVIYGASLYILLKPFEDIQTIKEFVFMVLAAFFLMLSKPVYLPLIGLSLLFYILSCYGNAEKISMEMKTSLKKIDDSRERMDDDSSEKIEYSSEKIEYLSEKIECLSEKTNTPPEKAYGSSVKKDVLIYENFHINKKFFIFLLIGYTIAFLGSVWWNYIIKYKGILKQYVDFASMTTQLLVNPDQQILNVLASPYRFMEVVLDTFAIHGKTLYHQFVGVFGWLEIPVPFYVVIAWTLLTIISLSLLRSSILISFSSVFSRVHKTRSTSKSNSLVTSSKATLIRHISLKKMHIIAGIASIAAIMGALLLLLLSAYMVWMPVDSEVIMLQGRYFHVLAACFIVALAFLKPCIMDIDNKNIILKIKYLLFAGALFCNALSFRALYLYYYV